MAALRPRPVIARVPVSVQTSTPIAPIRLNVGGSAYTDVLGQSWIADIGFNTGEVANDATGIDIANTEDDTLYRSQRWDRSTGAELSYNFNVPNGDYQVIFHFAESYDGNFAVGARVFDVSVEGQLLIDDLDIFNQA